jgi:hypothetical protein
VTTWVYVDESKRAGYVMAAVAVDDPDAARKILRGLIVPGRRRLHMSHEHVRRRRMIVSTLTAMPITVTVYDAARRYRRERDARGACLSALVEDLAVNNRGDIQLMIESDDSLVGYDNQRLIEAIRATGQRDTLHYQHLHPHEDLALALADVTAWCWVRSGEWRRRIGPILAPPRSV